jgi:hypothetical protein
MHGQQCGQKSGRYLWDGCNMEEIRAQFDMQDEFPIQLEHLVYIVLDINVNLRAGDYLTTKNLGKYLKRTRIVVEGLCHYSPEQDAAETRMRAAELVPLGYGGINKKVGDLTAEKRQQVCAGLLNALHAAVKLFEKHIPPSQALRSRHSQTRDVYSVSLDQLQDTCGVGVRNGRFASTQELWDRACVLLEIGSLPDPMFPGNLLELRLEQTALLKMVHKYSQKVSSLGGTRSMEVYLMDRMAIVEFLFNVFSNRFSMNEYRHIRPKLVENNSQIIKAFETLKCQRGKHREQTQANKQVKARNQILERL